MNAQWKKISDKIDSRSERERGLLFLVALAVVFLLGFNVFISPKMKQQKLSELKQQQDAAKMQTLTQELTVLQANQSADIDAEVKHQISEHKKMLDVVNGKLEQFQKGLVTPEKMDSLLETILKQNKSLKLVSLKSFPVVNIIPDNRTATEAVPASGAQTAVELKPVTSSADAEIGLFKHEVEIVLEGNYLDMLNYMRNLEAIPERLYWGKSHLRVIEYPNARLSLRVFTLSLEKKWLNM